MLRLAGIAALAALLSGGAADANESTRDALERLPIRWNHLIDKKSLQLPVLEHDLIAKVEPTSPDHALAVSQGAIGDLVPDLAFRSADGSQLRLGELRGKPVFINLIYTGCADVCPTIVERLGPAIDAANEALGADSYTVLSIGFDTRNDTPQRMRSFANAHGAGAGNWHFVATDQGTMQRLVDAVGFSIIPSAGGFDHMAQVTLLDKTGRIYRQIYGSDFDPPAIVEPLKELVFGREKSVFSLQGLSDRIKLFCTVYNPNTGRYYFNYSLFASIAIGAVSLLGVLAFLVREVRKHSWTGGA